MLNKEFQYLSEFGKRHTYTSLYKQMINGNPELGKPASGEQDWLNRWRQYDRHLKPYAYRIFSRYIGADLDIAPLEVVQNVVEPVLTPIMMSEYYSDKNTIGKVLPRALYERRVPIVYFRNIGGLYYTGDYKTVVYSDVSSFLQSIDSERVILKPSRQASGAGVQIFRKSRNGFENKLGEILTLEYLESCYKKDYLIQACLEQSDDLSLFNASSVNTIRLATYRDTRGEVHPLHAILRIGASGAEVDNAHSGGKFCGLSQSGILGKCAFDSLGNKTTLFNGLDFEKSSYRIPCFSEIIALAKEIAGSILHHNLIAFDIALNKDNHPMLIEYNTYGFSAWLFQFACGPVFGKFTEEIMSRCEAELKSYGGRIIVTSTI